MKNDTFHSHLFMVCGLLSLGAQCLNWTICSFVESVPESVHKWNVFFEELSYGKSRIYLEGGC